MSRFTVELLPQEWIDCPEGYDYSKEELRSVLAPCTQATLPPNGHCLTQPVLFFNGESGGKFTRLGCRSTDCPELPRCRLGDKREGYQDDPSIKGDPNGLNGLDINQLIPLTETTHV